MYDRLASDPNRWEKKTRRWEDKSDITELRDALRLRGEEWIAFAFDKLDIPEFVNFMPLFDLQNNKGCCHKNYYFYRDTGATNEWQVIIWDPDLAFGHDFESGGAAYFNDVMDWNNPLRRGSNNNLIGKLYAASSTPGFDEMYLRRLRTLMDQLLQPSDTPYEDRYLEGRIDEFIALLDPNDDPFDPTPGPPEWPDARHGVVLGTDDADLDYNMWGSWDHANGRRLHAARGETMREHAQRIKDEWLNQRRDFLYGQRGLPEAQVGNPILDFGVIEAEPASGDQAEEYIELANPQDTAVDISGWQLSEGVDFMFPAGTVIPSGWTLYVVADKNAFRARSNGPRGGQGLFIVGGWEGELSKGESLSLTGADGNVVRSTFISPDEDIPFHRGDTNADGEQNLTDAVFVLHHLFGGGEEPPCAKSADANDSGSVDLTDPVFLLNFLFAGGPSPPAPFPECGPDPTIDELTCESPEGCQ